MYGTPPTARRTRNNCYRNVCKHPSERGNNGVMAAAEGFTVAARTQGAVDDVATPRRFESPQRLGTTRTCTNTRTHGQTGRRYTKGRDRHEERSASTRVGGTARRQAGGQAGQHTADAAT